MASILLLKTLMKLLIDLELITPIQLSKEESIYTVMILILNSLLMKLHQMMEPMISLQLLICHQFSAVIVISIEKETMILEEVLPEDKVAQLHSNQFLIQILLAQKQT